MNMVGNKADSKMVCSSKGLVLAVEYGFQFFDSFAHSTWLRLSCSLFEKEFGLAPLSFLYTYFLIQKKNTNG